MRPSGEEITACDRAGHRTIPAPAPASCGGVSFGHGTAFHPLGPIRPARRRRACAPHRARNGNRFVTPATPCGGSLVVRII